MIERRLTPLVRSRLDGTAAVVLTGPRQVGKTTLARQIADERGGLYLDLESAADRARLLTDPRSYLAGNAERLVVLDEVHRVPELFRELRGAIDDGRRAGLRTNRFLLLGSGSMDLMRQSESLAGRVSYLELQPVDALEVAPDSGNELWLRGGFPDSLFSATGEASFQWRRDLIRTYLEREVPLFAPRVSTTALERLWTMLAHSQGGLLNAAALARSLEVSPKTVTSYVELLADLMMVRLLPPWSGNVGKRLVRSPKVYVRDSGLVHALLWLPTLDQVLGHPVSGLSWEGHVIEAISALVKDRAVLMHYRSATGAELDLVVEFADGGRWAIEIKRGEQARPSKAFHAACDTVGATRRLVVNASDRHETIAAGVEMCGLRALLAELAGAA